MSDDGSDELDGVELLRLSSRDPDAFGELYDRHAAAVMRYCLRRTGSPVTAADLTAEVLAAAYLSRRTFVDRGVPARAWLFGIARNQVGTFHRKERVVRHQGLPLVDIGTGAITDLGPVFPPGYSVVSAG